MTGFLRRWRFALPLLMAAAGGWAADARGPGMGAGMGAGAGGDPAGAPGVLIVREDSAVARQAAELLGKELSGQRWSWREVTVASERAAPGMPAAGDQLVVALGSRALAAAARQAAGRPLVAALVTRAALEEAALPHGERWSAIVLDQPMERWANLLRAAFPGRQSVGMLAGPTAAGVLRLLERKLAEQHMSLVAEAAMSSAEVVPALEKLLPRMSVLLALPDPLVHNRNTVQPLLLTTYRAGIPVVAYSESYQQAGAVLALYSTVPQIVAQVAASLRQWQEGRQPPAIQSPAEYTVGINAAVARSLGLHLPSAGELTDRLRAANQ